MKYISSADKSSILSLRTNNVSEAIQPSRALCCKAGSPRRLWLLAMTIALMMGDGDAFAAEPAEASAKEGVSAKYDTKLPVEISADNLEVLQKESRAIFKGNVIAVQGQLRLNADKMVVHYKQKTEAEKAKQQDAATTEGMGAVSLIEVEGNVLVATPEETARGDKGDYEVDKRFLRLTGENVTLVRDKNILRGKSVEYDLDTGRSVLTNKGGDHNAKGDNRVRGVFVPKSDTNPAKKP